MAFFPQEWLDEVRARNNIVEIIGEHVQLKRSGNTYKGIKHWDILSFMMNFE